MDLLVYCKHCQSAICLSVTKHHGQVRDAIDHDLNQFQRKQWRKHGQMMPKIWIDPFEIYD